MGVDRAEPAVGRRAANRRRLQQRLLDAVEEGLVAGTYAELSVEHLLEQAGVARSTFYYNFGDKAELLGALAGDIFKVFEEEALRSMARADELTKDSMREATVSLFRLYWEHRTVMVAMADCAASNAQIRDRLDRMWSTLAERVAEQIAAAQETQTWRRTDPRRTAAWLIWMTERGLYDLARNGDESEIVLQASAHAEICWAALAG